MTQNASIQLSGLALNFEGAPVPEWVQLTPAGPVIVGRDGRSWKLNHPEQVVAYFRSANCALPIDIDHATEAKPTGAPVPAQGHIEDLDVRDGALWGRVNWTDAGRALIAARAYRYLSPAFLHSAATGEIARLSSAALVHHPNLDMKALNSRQETQAMDPVILEALGLTPTSGAADAVLAINRLKEDKTLALNAAQNPDFEKFVPKADHQIALNRISAFETAETARMDLAMAAAVDGAVAAGKIAPASKDYHLATCKAVGLEAFGQMLATMPVLTGPGGAARQPGKTTVAALSAEELAVCSALDMTAEDFLKSKNNEG